MLPLSSVRPFAFTMVSYPGRVVIDDQYSGLGAYALPWSADCVEFDEFGGIGSDSFEQRFRR